MTAPARPVSESATVSPTAWLIIAFIVLLVVISELHQYWRDIKRLKKRKNKKP